VGGGTIGLCTLQALRACGVVDVYVIERYAAKRRFAEELGACEFIHAEQADPRQVVLDRTGGLGVDFAFECVGSGSALDIALSVTRPGGTVCLTGAIPHPTTIDWLGVLMKEKTITTSNGYDYEFPVVIALLNDGRLKAESLITTTIPLDAALRLLTNFEEEGQANIKMLIEINP
jgi:threonine dehydrogenase-like Zn-dependent dehydrogenase